MSRVLWYTERAKEQGGAGAQPHRSHKRRRRRCTVVHGGMAPPAGHDPERSTHPLVQSSANLGSNRLHAPAQSHGADGPPLGHVAGGLIVHLADRHVTIDNPPQPLVAVGRLLRHEAVVLQRPLATAVRSSELRAEVVVLAGEVAHEVGVARRRQLLPVRAAQLAAEYRVTEGLIEVAVGVEALDLRALVHAEDEAFSHVERGHHERRKGDGNMHLHEQVDLDDGTTVSGEAQRGHVERVRRAHDRVQDVARQLAANGVTSESDGEEEAREKRMVITTTRGMRCGCECSRCSADDPRCSVGTSRTRVSRSVEKLNGNLVLNSPPLRQVNSLSCLLSKRRCPRTAPTNTKKFTVSLNRERKKPGKLAKAGKPAKGGGGADEATVEIASESKPEINVKLVNIENFLGAIWDGYLDAGAHEWFERLQMQAEDAQTLNGRTWPEPVKCSVLSNHFTGTASTWFVRNRSTFPRDSFRNFGREFLQMFRSGLSVQRQGVLLASTTKLPHQLYNEYAHQLSQITTGLNHGRGNEYTEQQATLSSDGRMKKRRYDAASEGTDHGKRSRTGHAALAATSNQKKPRDRWDFSNALCKICDQRRHTTNYHDHVAEQQRKQSTSQTAGHAAAAVQSSDEE
ncbi:hypothetical protein ON010_g3265 [Phytophthora cinnamomi]|nr:hypothetical protein ON010_g3265 [Phytophthora cinnamomi]